MHKKQKNLIPDIMANFDLSYEGEIQRKQRLERARKIISDYEQAKKNISERHYCHEF